MSERIYNHSPDCDCLDPFIIKPCNCHYQELTTLRARVRELEDKLESVTRNAVDMLTDGACETHINHIKSISFRQFQEEERSIGCKRCHAARIRELEEAMPKPDVLRQMADDFDAGYYTFAAPFRRMADKIEKVMTEQPEGKNE